MHDWEGRYNALFERSLYCVFVHDLEGNFVDANDAALNLLGYNKGDDKALNFSDLLDEEQMPLGRKTLGLQLVTDLVQQVNGSIMLGKTHGTEFIVRF